MPLCRYHATPLAGQGQYELVEGCQMLPYNNNPQVGHDKASLSGAVLLTL